MTDKKVVKPVARAMQRSHKQQEPDDPWASPSETIRPEKSSGFFVSVYDQFPDSGRKSRIAHWLQLERWTLEQAAMLFCDVSPELTELDEHSRLVSCVSLRNEVHGDSARLWAAAGRLDSGDADFDGDGTLETEGEDGTGDNRDVRPVLPVADQLDDMLNVLRASLAAETIKASMPPALWLSYAQQKNITVPWRAWAESRARDFPWLKSVGGSEGSGPQPNVSRGAHRRTAERNTELQQAANKLAESWNASARRDFSKREIARELAKTDQFEHMTAGRIERLISVQWTVLA